MVETATARRCDRCHQPFTGASWAEAGLVCEPCFHGREPLLPLPPPSERWWREVSGGNDHQRTTTEPRVYSFPAQSQAEPQAAPFRAEGLDALLEAQDEPLEVVISDGDEGAVLTADGKGFIAGATGIGKTNLIIRLSRCLCGGDRFLGLPIPAPRRVLYLALEGSRRGYRRRLRKVWADATPETRARFHLAHLTLNVMDEADLERLGSLLYQVRPEVLIIDPLRNAHSLDENISHEMARLTATLDGLIDRHDCALVCAHHDRKRPPFTRRDTGTDRVRGSTALAGWLTFCLTLDADPSGPDRLTAEWVKTRDAEVSLPALALEFDRERLDFIESGRVAEGKVSDETIVNAIRQAGGHIRGPDLIRGLMDGCGAGERWTRNRLRVLVKTGTIGEYVAPTDRRTGAKTYVVDLEPEMEEEP